MVFRPRPAGLSGTGPAIQRQRSARLRRFGLLASSALLGVALAACERGPSAESRRIDQLEFKIQQLEKRLNLSLSKPAGGDPANRMPAGRIKSVTLRTGTEDDRLRIYWADGTTTDLPCTKEQATLACG